MTEVWVETGIVESAGAIFKLAVDAHERTAGATGREPGQLDAVTAVVMAEASLEAFINEAATLASIDAKFADPMPGAVRSFSRVLRENERSQGSIQLKYQMS